MKKFSKYILLVIFGFLIGYKSEAVIRNKIYFPLRERISGQKSPNEEKFILNKQQQVAVKCPDSSFQIAYFGQSNSANSVKPKASLKIPSNLYQYDWQSRKCYRYKEPLIGTTGLNGNVITYTAVNFALETGKPIIIIPFGKSGSSVFEWAYGNLSHHQNLALENIQKNNLYPNVFLWHQGESDHGNSQSKYKDALQIVLNKTRQFFPKSYFGISIASKCRNIGWEPVREGQKEIIKFNKNTFMSADSDKIFSKKSRYDYCHFSNIGAKELGEIYFKSIKKFLNLEETLNL